MEEKKPLSGAREEKGKGLSNLRREGGGIPSPPRG